MEGVVGPAEKSFHVVDLIVFLAVLLTSLGIGVYHAMTGGKQKTTQEYFMGDRKLKTLPVALSILVSFVSAILVLGTPAEIYTRGTELTMRVLGYCLACVLSSLFLVPLLYPLKITSSFEYLEQRYRSHVVKLMGSFMMLIGNIFYMGLLMYTPSTALEAVTPLPVWVTVVVTGCVATLYTAIGGIKAVVWTDVFQAMVMILGMLAIVIQGTILTGGIGKVLQVNQEGGRLIFFNFNPDPTQRLSFWSLIIGGAFSTLTIFGIGQSSVQRYSSLPTLAQAKRCVYLNIPGLLIVNILASLVGLVVYAYYSSVGCDPLNARYISNANQLVPYFVIDVLNYPGIPGLFLAVLFSGAMSSLSSSLNGAAAVTWQDILRPLCDSWREESKMLLTKLLVVIFGACGMAVAFVAEGLGGHVLQASLSFTGATMGPSLGMFLLGALFRKANAIGAVSGCMAAITFNLWVALGAFIHKPYSRTTLPTSAHNCMTSHDVTNTSLISDVINTSLANMTSSGAAYTSREHTALRLESLVERPDIETIHESSVTNSYLGSIINLTHHNSSLISSHAGYDVDIHSTVIPSDSYIISTSLHYSDSPSADLEGLEKLYAMSFLWYACVGCLISVTLGLLISLVTDKWYRETFAEPPVRDELLIPVCARMRFCLPRSLRHRFMRRQSITLQENSAQRKAAVDTEAHLKICTEKEYLSGTTDTHIQQIDSKTPLTSAHTDLNQTQL